MYTRLKFNNKSKSPFMATTRARVDQYFTDVNKPTTGNGLMWVKTIIFLGGFLFLYLLIISNIFGAWILLPLAILLGMFSAFVGFNICHDAIHGSFSSRKIVNNIFSHVFHFLGAGPYVWTITHNAVHHTYTNIPGHDEDIDVAPGLIRISNEEPVNKIQRYQHWYAFPLYSLASFSWAFRKDYKKFFQPSVGHIRVKHPKIEYFNLFFYKGLYYFLFIALPLLVLSIS